MSKRTTRPATRDRARSVSQPTRSPERVRRAAGRPPGVASDETRARILAAACGCFAARGYARTSNQQIARAAGLTTGALYHYFDSKAELFAAVHAHVQGVLLGIYEKAFAQDAPCVEQLCAGLDGALELTVARPDLAHFAAIAALEIERHPELHELGPSDTVGARAFFARMLGAAKRRGEIAPGVDAQAIVDLVVSSLFGLAWLRSQVAKPAEYAAAIHAFQSLLRGTLFRAPRRR